MSNAMKILIGVLLVVVVGVGAATLMGGDDEPAAGDMSTTSTVSPLPGGPGGTPDTSSATTTTSGSTTTTTATPGADQCVLVGTWRLRGQEFFDSLAAASGTDAEISYMSGAYLVELRGDGTYVGNRQAWTFRVSTGEGAIVVTITSEDPGTWIANDARIQVVEAGGSEATVSLAIEVGDQLTPMPVGSQVPVETDGFQGSGAYTCVGDVLTIHVDDEGIPITAVFDREG